MVRVFHQFVAWDCSEWSPLLHRGISGGFDAHKLHKMKRSEKLLFKFAEWCLNIPLLEMASDRNDKISKIQSKMNTINEHLIKYYLIPKSIDRNHWFTEINARFNEILRLNWGKKRRFDKEDYYDWLFINYYYNDIGSIRMSAIEDTIQDIIKRYSTTKEYFIEYDINEMVIKIGELLKEICEYLELGTYTSSIFKNEIKKLNENK